MKRKCSISKLLPVLFLVPVMIACSVILFIQGCACPASSNQNYNPRWAAYQMSACETMVPGTPPKDDFDYNSLKTESYASIVENPFLDVLKNPHSTFSIDVDTASYSNARRMILQGNLPPKDSVRIEEFINYFDYSYPEPTGKDPFSVTTQVANCPWNKDNRLVLIGLKGKSCKSENLPPANLVFLIDVSGSMTQSNRLPLVKSALKLLVEQMRPEDRVAIVTYAGQAEVALQSTSGKKKLKIVDAIDKLSAGGSTAGGAGINLAYEIAKKNFKNKGNNRVILCTDGDFNVGVESLDDLQKLIEERKKDGIFLTVLGFGMGNLKDDKMELLADKGNGNYAYIDSLLEARKVLVNEFSSTLMTIAKDVKIQTEFNPVHVKAYRLIGYENRILKTEDFEDDKKDAGEIGAGHRVTALYEIVPAKPDDEKVASKYVETKAKPDAFKSNEIMTVNLRYKLPKSDKSELMVVPAKYYGDVDGMSPEFQFAAAVAEFGMLLRQSQFKGDASYDSVIKLAEAGKGQDSDGYRSEFIQLVKAAKPMKPE